MDVKIIEELKRYSIEQLEELKQHIDEIIRDKKADGSHEFTFEFNATSDPRKGKPYVARLYWADGKLQRAFKDLFERITNYKQTEDNDE